MSKREEEFFMSGFRAVMAFCNPLRQEAGSTVYSGYALRDQGDCY